MQREVRAVAFLWITLLISLLIILLIILLITPCMISGRGTDSACPEMSVLSVLTRNVLRVIAKIPG